MITRELAQAVIDVTYAVADDAKGRDAFKKLCAELDRLKKAERRFPIEVLMFGIIYGATLGLVIGFGFLGAA